MIDLEDVMKRHAERARREYERTQAQKLPSLYRQVLKRARRRRMLKKAGGSVMALAVSTALLSVSFTAEPQGPAPSRRLAAASVNGSESEPPTRFGFWPYVRRDLSEHVCGSSVLKGSENAAAGFAASMLRWTNVVIIGENRFEDRITSTIGELPEPFVGGPLPPHPVIELDLERLRSQDCWWVTGISDPGSEARFSAVVEDGDLVVSFPLLTGAERADVIAVESGNNVRRYRAGDEGNSAVRFDDFDGPGFVMVMWVGADGEVFSATGTILPAGDSSTRAR